jgi:ribonuclease PH
MRNDGRSNLELRALNIVPDYIKNVPASVLIEQGDTRVVCTATFDEKVPYFLKDSNQGWLTAEYGMLPGSVGNQRVVRERQKSQSRHIEIQRLIGRALRCTFNPKTIAGKTIVIDTDVIQADGSTRCAAVIGGMVVLIKMMRYLVFETLIPDLPGIEIISAVSIGVKDNGILVDLNYKEDSAMDADINIVSSQQGNIVGIQAMGEKKPVRRDTFQEVIDIGIEKNLEIIKQIKAITGS